MFNNVPVVVNTFNVELRAGIDYISTIQNTVYTKNPHADIADTSVNATWAPTISNISVLVTPTYSRESLTKFSLQDFASGNLSNFGASSKNKNDGIGFI